MTQYFRTLDSAGTAVFDTNPDPDSWVQITQAEYDTLVAAVPNPRKDDVNAFLSGAGISDPGAVAALYRLFGQTP